MHETPKSGSFGKFKAELLEKILGKYAPGSYTQIVYLPGLSNDNPLFMSTALHESVHSLSFTQTHYGFFQTMLAQFSEIISLGERKRNLLNSLWEKSLVFSLEAHEGFATYLQLQYVHGRLGPQKALEWLQKKPVLYQSGCRVYAEITKLLSCEEFPAERVAPTVSDIAFNTPILEYAEKVFDNDPTECILALERHSPNARLHLLHQYLLDPSTAGPFAISLRKVIDQVLQTRRPPILDRTSKEEVRVAIQNHISANICSTIVKSVPDLTKSVHDAFNRFTSALKSAGYDGEDTFEIRAAKDRDHIAKTVFKVPEDDHPNYLLVPYERLLDNIREGMQIADPQGVFQYHVHIFAPSHRNFPTVGSSFTVATVNCSGAQQPIEDEMVYYGTSLQMLRFLKALASSPTTIFVTSFENRSDSKKAQFLRNFQDKVIHYYLQNATLENIAQVLSQLGANADWEYSLMEFTNHDVPFFFSRSADRSINVFTPVTTSTVIRLRRWISITKRGKLVPARNDPQRLRDQRKIASHFSHFGY